MSGTRVLILIASTNRRGAEIEGANLAPALVEQGLSAEVAALAPGTADKLLEVDCLGDSPLGVTTLRALRRKASEFDLVIAYGSTTLPACAIALAASGIPFVYRSIGDPTAWSGSRLKQLRTGLLMRRAAHVVALWPEASEAIGDLYGVPASRRSFIPNSRSSDEFRPPTCSERGTARRQFGLQDDEVAVVCVGALAPEKRVDRIIGAMAADERLKLVIAGNGPLRAELEASASALGVSGRVNFLGSVDDARSVYWAADVLALPSATEGMPGVLIEAGLCGVPVIASEVGAVSWMLDQHVAFGEGLRRETGHEDWAAALHRTASAGPHSPATSIGHESVARAWAELLPTLQGAGRTLPR